MKKIIFLLLMLPVIVFSQSPKCPYGDKYYPKCNDKGEFEKCMSGYSEHHNKARTQQWCLCDSLKNAEAYAKSLGLLKGKIAKLEVSDKKQNAQISEIQKENTVQNAEIKGIKDRVSILETRSVEKPETVSGFNGPEKLEEKSVPPSTPKKQDPDPGPAREAPTETVVVPPSFFVEPELGVFWKNNNSPEFTSKNLWLVSLGIRLRYQPQNWRGLFIFAKPSWVNIFGKSYLPETTPSPYPTQAVSLNGFLAEGGVGYRIWEYTEISAGYAYAISKSMEHESGAFADLEFGLEKVPVKLQLGLKYKHDYEFFGGVIARFPLGPKNKAPG